MKRLVFILLFLINNLFADTINDMDLEILEDLGMDSSYLDDPSLKNAYKEYSTSEKIAYYDTMFKKASFITNIVKDEIENEELPFPIIFIPLIETGYVNQVGKKGSSGLWQIMPVTARHLNLRNDDFIDERLDLIKSTDFASVYLRKFYANFGKWYLAILAYNAGEGRIIDGVARATLDNYLDKNPTMFNDKVIRLYKIYLEDYEKKKKGIDNLYDIYRDLGEKEGYYDLSYLLKNNKQRDYLPQTTVDYLHKIVIFSMITNRDLFKNLDRKSKYDLQSVKAYKGLKLKVISDAIGMNYAEFKELNRHFKKEILPLDSKPYNLYIPHTKLEAYNTAIKKIQPPNIAEVQHELILEKSKEKAMKIRNKVASNKNEYIVVQGDTLDSISKKYKVSVEKLKKDNKKKSNKLKIGEKIEIYK